MRFFRSTVTSLLLVSLSMSVLSASAVEPKAGFFLPDFLGDFFKNNKSPITREVSFTERLHNQSQIKRFKDTEEVGAFLDGISSGSGFGGGLIRTIGRAENVATAVPTPATDIKMSMPTTGGGSDFSTTNIQVAGVDEGDIVKTDGSFIYYASGTTVYIAEATPAQNTNIIGRIDLESNPQGLYLNKDTLTVYGHDAKIYEKPFYSSLIRQGSYTFVKVYNISDKKNPKLIRDLSYEGNYAESRMIGDYLYFVTNMYRYGFEGDSPLPRILANGEEMAVEKNPKVFYFDIPYTSVSMTTVGAINVITGEEAPNRDIYLLPGGQNFYVSQNNLYLTYTKYLGEDEVAFDIAKELLQPQLPRETLSRISEVNTVPDYILSTQEKSQKRRQILERYIMTLSKEERTKIESQVAERMKATYNELAKEMEKTVIHKIALNKNELEYKAVGEVTGSVLNQFAMDEKDGNFRIATTRNRLWSQYADDSQTASTNSLYVLDNNMKQIGAVEGLANDERIYSVRFMQDRAYMVTFKQVDPLFVIDLKDPTKPTVLGELKVPGFSTYLHPYDETTLIGLGRDADENKFGNVEAQGVKLSLFDVSNVNEPKEVSNYIIEGQGTTSEALYDHKAFLFSKEKNLLVIPVQQQESYDKAVSFRGAMIFTVRKDKVELKGKVEHESPSDNGGGVIEPMRSDIAPRYWNPNIDAAIKRALYIGDNLYTLSDKYLGVHKLNDLTEIKKLQLKFLQ